MKKVMLFVVLICLCGSLQEAPQKRVLIDISHSAGTAKPDTNMVALPQKLPQYSFEIKEELLTRELLKGYSAVILYQPQTVLQDTEVEVLTEFVKKGGGLVICGQHDVGWNDESRASYNRLSETFGITFLSNAIDDPTNKRGCYCTPIIHVLEPHPLTQGVTQIVLYRPCALRVSGTAVVIARGDEDTRTIGADEVTGSDVIAAAAAEYGKGRVVALGSHTVFDDSFINEPDNLLFGTNLFAWVTEKAASAQTGSVYSYLGVGVIAAFLVLAVAVRGIKRKKERGQK